MSAVDEVHKRLCEAINEDDNERDKHPAEVRMHIALRFVVIRHPPCLLNACC